MFAFVSARTRDGQVTGLNVLRVHEESFGAFLSAWTEGSASFSTRSTRARL